MPRAKTTHCNRCGELMETTLTEGKARCHPCRRVASLNKNHVRTPTMCPWCWQVFMARPKQRFCSHLCGMRADGERRRVRAPNDNHQQRCDREKNAPGLRYKARHDLLARWRRQGKTCMYCDALATTIDHVVPLVRGGTNYEGNLVPCCKRCNSSKTYFTVIEWRTGKRLPRMGRALAWQNRVRPAKVKQPKATHPCPVCAVKTARKVYCSEDCYREHCARVERDRYRAAHGIPVDPLEPTRPHGRRRKTVGSLKAA